MEWMEDAKCKNNTTVKFFPEKGSNGTEAKKFCESCPVRIDCLQYALDNIIIEGIWGGKSGWERRLIRRGKVRV
jgi:WhiB family redox-sensing transcriptional regulator